MKRRGSLARLAVALTVASLALFALGVQAQVAPPTLGGEQLSASGSAGPVITTNCNPNDVSTLTFSVSGTVAGGPYPGTFTEVGTATIGLQTFPPDGGTPTGAVLTYDAIFTIHSPVGEVTGTKTLPAPAPGAFGDCVTVNNAEEIAEAIGQYSLRYQAQISTPDGVFADRGLVPLVAVQRVLVFGTPPVITFDSFVENLESELAAPEPLISPGLATGGGQIPADVTFGFNAKSDENGVKGNCTVIDRTANPTVMVKCLDATTYFQTSSHASFAGNATVNGVATTYRIEVDDFVDPGVGSDTFKITTASGYTASGVLTQGNIQIHQ